MNAPSQAVPAAAVAAAGTAAAAAAATAATPAAANGQDASQPAPASAPAGQPSTGQQAEAEAPKKPKHTKPRNRTKGKDKNRATQDMFVPFDMWPRPYVFEDGLRRVSPYDYTYQTWVKERWRGRELIDVFESEFRDRPLAYYQNAMETGKVTVNHGKVSPHHILQNGQLVAHQIHRHEPPVIGEPIGVIHEDEDMIVINKPSGIPVHPAGRYNFNSVVEIMKEDRGRDFVAHPCNRLDRLTSGIMFVAKNTKAAGVLAGQIMQRTVRKEYIARVIGDFPEGEVVCDQPLLQVSPKLGLNRVRASGKHARTVFKKLAYYPRDDPVLPGQDGSASTFQDGQSDPERPWVGKKGYSIVRCLPVTGRTHQIRVHLQHLGHPIQNDPIYANQRVWGTSLGRNDPDASENTDDDIISRLSRMGKEEVASAVAYYDHVVDMYHEKKAEKMSGKLCEVCDTPLYTDPGLHELTLWLHSLRYEDAGGSWAYVSPLPSWALPPVGMSGPTEVGGMEELVEAVKDENPEIA